MPRKSTARRAAVLPFRTLGNVLASRIRWLSRAGITFLGKRDLYRVLGYKRELDVQDFRERYERNAIAARVVEALPKSTWRGGGELIEDDDPDTLTPFEEAFWTLSRRLHVWSYLLRGDILAGIGHFSVVMIGAPGELSSPLPPGGGSSNGLMYLHPYSEEETDILTYNEDPKSPRFGQALEYAITRKNRHGFGRSTLSTRQRRVHWTRMIHVADDLLDDQLFSPPRMERCWNLLDDLEKVTGGGSEAFWLRANQGIHVDIDKEMELEPEDEEEFQEEVDEYVHGQSRVIRTRGTTVASLGSDVANFSGPADAIITQIAGGTGIPKRILVGSERGDLASTQDRSNWNDRINDRRGDFADPFVVRQLVDRLIEFNYLPKPKDYDVRWPQIQNLDEIERAQVAKKWTSLNADFPPGDPVVLQNEVRDRLLGLPPLGRVSQGPATTEEINGLNRHKVLKRPTKDFKALIARKRAKR